MATLGDLEYVQLQLALEGIGFDRNRRLIRIPATAAEEIPRLYVGRHSVGWFRYYRADLPKSIVEPLERLTDEACFDQQPIVRRILDHHAPSLDVWSGTSYTFATVPPVEASPDVVALGPAERSLAIAFDSDLATCLLPIYAVIVDGQVVSTCVSARENDRSAEAWVQTATEFRRRGLARQVTAAWARDVLDCSKIAFYSHRRENLASLGVARTHGLRPFVETVGYL